MEMWTNTVTTGNTTTAYPVVISGGGTWNAPVYVGGGGGGGSVTLNGWPAPGPVPQSALEWLDAEVDKVCALAR